MNEISFLIFKNADGQLNNRLDMGKKKITKEPKSARKKAKEEDAPEPEDVPVSAPSKKKANKASKSSSEVNIFS